MSTVRRPIASLGLSGKQGGGGVPEDNGSRTVDDSNPPLNTYFPVPELTSVPIVTTETTGDTEVVKTSTLIMIKPSNGFEISHMIEATKSSTATQPASITRLSHISLKTSLTSLTYTSAGVVTTATATETVSVSFAPPPASKPAQHAHESNSGLSKSSEDAIIGVAVSIIILLVIVFFGVRICLRRRLEKIISVEETAEVKPLRSSAGSQSTVPATSPFGDDAAILPGPDENLPPSTNNRCYEEHMASNIRAVDLNLTARPNSRTTNNTIFTPVTIASSIRGPSPAPVQGLGQIARPFSGAALITLSGVLPSYEESQIRSEQAQRPFDCEISLNTSLTHGLPLPILSRQSASFHEEELEAEYEAEAARMAGFLAPARLLGAQREREERRLTSALRRYGQSLSGELTLEKPGS
jgi:hypothetical protein